MKKKLLWAVIPLGIAIAAGAAFYAPHTSGKPAGKAANHVFTKIAKGSIENTVTSSGTLAPVSTVSVISQMSGRVEKVLADYNDRVKKGQVLITLNTEILKLQEEDAGATLRKVQANYNLQTLDFENKTKLATKGLISDYDLKSSATALEIAAADLVSAQSALKLIEKKLEQYAVITSPIDGIVLDRSVDEGQSVIEGSSTSTSSLFTLAEDLAHMEIKAEVDELDIGSIKAGQDVRFTVEARPGESYMGKVHEIRLVPETTNKVVNYFVIIDANNDKGTLLPGMTAQVDFIIERKTDVLVVSNAAFRYKPTSLSADEIEKAIFLAGLGEISETDRQAASARYDEQKRSAETIKTTAPAKTGSGGLSGIMMPGPGGPGGQRASSEKNLTDQETGTTASTPEIAKKTLWYFAIDGKLQATMVEIGVSDGTKTEILNADSLEGKNVILKETTE